MLGGFVPPKFIANLVTAYDLWNLFGILLAFGEYTAKDGIYIADVPFEGEGFRNLIEGQVLADTLVGLDQLAEICIIPPGSHRMLLHNPVRFLTEHPGSGEIQQDLAGEN